MNWEKPTCQRGDPGLPQGAGQEPSLLRQSLFPDTTALKFTARAAGLGESTGSGGQPPGTGAASPPAGPRRDRHAGFLPGVCGSWKGVAWRVGRRGDSSRAASQGRGVARRPDAAMMGGRDPAAATLRGILAPSGGNTRELRRVPRPRATTGHPRATSGPRWRGAPGQGGRLPTSPLPRRGGLGGRAVPAHCSPQGPGGWARVQPGWGHAGSMMAR